MLLSNEGSWFVKSLCDAILMSGCFSSLLAMHFVLYWPICTLSQNSVQMECILHSYCLFCVCVANPNFSQVKVEDIDAYAPKDLLIVTTGSQVRQNK